MALAQFSSLPLGTFTAIFIILLALPAVYLLGWLLFLDPLRHIPGPFVSRVSSIWIATQCRLYRRSRKVHELHERYGDVVRIATNHVSVNRPEALQELYNHHRE